MAGFECEFVEKPPKAFHCECPVCLQVLREPYQATCCGKSFCKKCIHRIKAANQACPTCNDKDFTLFHNKGLQQSLYDFRVYCTHKSKGCEWTGELRELDNHLNSDPPADKALQGCLFTLIKCPLGCAGCVEGVPRKSYKSHIHDNIDKLLNLVVRQAAVIESLKQQNTELAAQVANIEGDKQYLKQQVTELAIKISKLDEKYGEVELKNRELENEVKMKQSVVASKSQPAFQPSSMQQAVVHITGTYKPIGAEFTMTNFEEYRKDNDIWYSPYFYTHPSGYKMCLKVYANGSGPGKGTHLSVYVFLMRGEFDEQLKWPFHGNVTVKLVNQEEDRNHFVDTVQFSRSAPRESCQRVMKEGRSGCGHGCGKFLPLAELRPKYLKNDCIKLCIKRIEII